MHINKFKERKESEDYKKLDVNSNVILYKNNVRGLDNDCEWGIWVVETYLMNG